jgi:hypothetical protein
MKYESVGALLAVEHATAAAVELLRSHEVESVVLRGPILVRFLYEEAAEVRGSMDVDLLVPELAGASAIFESNGYRVVVDWTPSMEPHAWTHVREASITVDLHRTLIGLGVPPGSVWPVFQRESREFQVAGVPVRAPGESLQALIVALHAAQHGQPGRQPLEDLRRALEVFDETVWSGAVRLAGEMDARPAFEAGMQLDSRGRELAEYIGVKLRGTRGTLLRAAHGSGTPVVLGVDRMLDLRGWPRLVFVVGKLFPPRAFMRDRYEVARRGRGGLALAYVYRLAWIVRWLPRGVTSVWKASRRARQ